MIVSLGLKSFLVSGCTGGITEMFKMFLLYSNQSTQKVLIFSNIFSYSISYIAQRYIFCGGRFFGISLLKFSSVALIAIQISAIFLHILENISFIKNFIEDKNISETRRKIYNYLLINASILIIYFCFDYHLRKSFVFVKNKSIDYKYSYMLYGLAILIYIFSTKYLNINIFGSSDSSVTSHSTIAEIKLVNNEMKMENNEIKLVNNEMKMENNEMKMENNEIKLVNNEMKMQNNEIKMENNYINSDDNIKKRCN
jgi:hypothetical protein